MENAQHGDEPSHSGLLAQPQRAAQWRPTPTCIDLWLVQWSDGFLWRPPAPEWMQSWTPAQRARAAAIGDPQLRSRYQWTQIWMAQVLGRYRSAKQGLLRIVKDAKGRPEIEGGGVSLSLTHCGDMALLAVDPQAGRIGVDLELRSPHRRIDAVVERFFSPQEQNAFLQLPACLRRAAFYRWWTAKEALAKAQGEGLSSALLRTPFPLWVEGLQLSWGGHDWVFRDLGLWRQRQGALCLPKARQSAPLRAYWLSAQELA